MTDIDPHQSRICKAKAKVRDENGDVVLGEDGKVMWRPCRRYAIRGGTVCYVHGGNSPRAQAKAQSRFDEIRTQREELRAQEKISSRIVHLMEELGLPPDIEDPLAGLLAAVRRTGSMVFFLELMVGELHLEVANPVDDLIEELIGVRAPSRAIAGPNHQGDGAPHVAVKMYKEWIEIHAKVCKMALEAGVEERQVRVAEELGQALARTMNAVLDELELTDEQRERALPAMTRHLRMLGEGAA